jgi:hypothetical protein
MNNPSGMAGLTGTSMGMSYENYFQLPEMGMASFSFGIPTKSGVFGLGYNSFGFSGLRQNQASLAYGRAFDKRLRAGIGLHWLTVAQPAGYTDLFAIVPSIGIQVMPHENVRVGFTVFNPAQQDFRPSGYKKIPSAFLAGIGYRLGREVWVCLEAEKGYGETARYTAGIEVNPHETIRFRFGVVPVRGSTFSFGLGYKFKKMSVDASVLHCPVPGYRTALGITYTI